MALYAWLGHAKIEFTHAKNPLRLVTKDGEETDLLKVCESVTPPCKINPFLFNGHVQTCYTAVWWKGTDLPVWYKRRLFRSDNDAVGGDFAVDFAVKEYPKEQHDPNLWPRTSHFEKEHQLEFDIGSKDSRPMLITLHGLVGGSHETYLRAVISPLLDAGWEACVLNARGCARHKVTSPYVFNARATWDVRQLVKWLTEKFPNRPLFAIGYSLGANILTNVGIPRNPSFVRYFADSGIVCWRRGCQLQAKRHDHRLQSVQS